MERSIDDPVAHHLFTEAQEGTAVFDDAGVLIAWNAAARAITDWDHTGEGRSRRTRGAASY